MHKNRTFFPARRLAADAILIAIFFVLSLLSVEFTGLKITFDSLPVILAAMLFGPSDAFLVGFLGALLEQLIHYGITVTTLLWVIPPAARGIVVGLCAISPCRAFVSGERWNAGHTAVYFISCLLAAMITSLLNTLVYYVDAKLFDYYHYALIFGVLGMRILTGLISGAFTAAVSLPILASLRRAGIASGRTEAERE